VPSDRGSRAEATAILEAARQHFTLLREQALAENIAAYARAAARGLARLGEAAAP
jgi:hypothetical protein